MDNRNPGGFRSMPKPVNLNAPEYRRAPRPQRSPAARPLPRFDSDGYGGIQRDDSSAGNGPRIYVPDTKERPAYVHRVQPPQNAPQRKRRPKPAPIPPPSRRRPPNRRQQAAPKQGILDLVGINFRGISINPMYKHIAVVVIGIATIIAVTIILVSNAMAYNALAVHVDGEHIGYIEYAPGWNSQAFHDEAVRDLQTRRGVTVTVSEQVTLELARVPQSDISTNGEMLSLISQHHFTYSFTAIAIYAFNIETGRYHREALMRSYEDVEATRYQLSRRFINANTVEWRFDPDWRLQPVVIYDEDGIVFFSPEDAFARLDRRVRDYGVYEVQPGDNATVIARMFQMNLTEFLQRNNLTGQDTIHIGDRVLVVTSSPLLPVVTIDEVSTVEDVTAPVEMVPVSTLPTGGVRLRQEGRGGSVEYITRTIRRNGEVVEVVRERGRVFVEPEYRIYEIGE